MSDAHLQNAAAGNPGSSGDANAPSVCDLVLKGGITSGVVYPGAIVRLSADYRFHQLGGTSAGAIAAAAAAAAELGRQTGNVAGSFQLLAELPTRLGAPSPQDPRKSALLAMFQPTADAGRLFDTIIAAAGGGRTAVLRVVGAATRNFPLFALLGVLPGVLALLVCPLSAHPAGRVIQLLLVAGIVVVGLVLALISALYREATRVLQPGQGWGLCSGVRREGDKEDPQALSNWLHSYFNELAGLGEDEILTFGHLWQANPTPADELTPTMARRIVLKVMTTSLSTQRPYSVPFETSDAHDLYFRIEDLREVLPKRVLDHLEKYSSESDTFPTYRHLPPANQLPVLLAVRMSLSFPFLLSAVKLYSPDHSRVRVADMMQPQWFSDGGICNNIPIHFFDSPIPVNPTFAINLMEPHPDAGAKADDVQDPQERARLEQRIKRRRRMAFANDNSSGGGEGYRSYFHETTGAAGIVAFAMAVVDSARNWVDASQMRLQGYRERVGNVVVSPDEGGLNLSMPQATIEALSKRGDEVAADLHHVFTARIWSGHATGMQRHRWMRVRNQLGALATYFSKIRTSITAGNLTATDLKNMVSQHPGTNTVEDRCPSQQLALQELIEALDVASASPAVAHVKDKSDADLTLRPRY